jgi:hypothetical protein
MTVRYSYFCNLIELLVMPPVQSLMNEEKSESQSEKHDKIKSTLFLKKLTLNFSVIKEGWLSKKADSFVASWNKRYFVLFLKVAQTDFAPSRFGSSEFRYYETESPNILGQKPRNSFLLSEVKSLRIENSKKFPGFPIEISYGKNKTAVVSADTAEMRKDWLIKLAELCAINYVAKELCKPKTQIDFPKLEIELTQLGEKFPGIFCHLYDEKVSFKDLADRYHDVIHTSHKSVSPETPKQTRDSPKSKEPLKEEDATQVSSITKEQLQRSVSFRRPSVAVSDGGIDFIILLMFFRGSFESRIVFVVLFSNCCEIIFDT